MVTLGLVLLFVIGFSLLSPSLDTLARRFTQFFSPYPSSQAGEGIAVLETSHPHKSFNLSIAEAESLAGFKIRRIPVIPREFHLIGAVYDQLREAIILHFTTETDGLVLRISQQRVDSDYQGIGPDAVVEMVAVGPYAGEFVAGGWMIPEVKSGVEATESPTTSLAIWDANVNLQTLRWSDGEFLYEIILAGDLKQPGYLNKQGLIALASQMQ